MLPFLEDLGRPVPPWDFRVEGVTEISADIHKYGYTPKGASVILHRDADWRDLQWFLYADWPSGIYGSPGGGRGPTGRADRHRLGRHAAPRAVRLPGHRRDPARGAPTTVRAGVEAIDGLALVGDPIGPVMAIEATDPGLDIFAIGDDVDANGWFTTATPRRSACTSCCRRPTRRWSSSWWPTSRAAERNRAEPVSRTARTDGGERQVRYS